MATQVSGFNDYEPEYTCCHYRSCAMIIGIFCAVVGGLLCGGSLYIILSEPAAKYVFAILIGAIWTCFTCLAGVLLIFGMRNERKTLVVPFMIFEGLNIILTIFQCIVIITSKQENFKKSISRDICQPAIFNQSVCEEKSDTIIIIAYGIILCFEVLFLYLVYKAFAFLKEKSFAKYDEQVRRDPEDPEASPIFQIPICEQQI